MSEYEPKIDRPPTFEQRVQRARQGVMELYLDDPNPTSAHLLVTLEQLVQTLREERRKAQKDA